MEEYDDYDFGSASKMKMILRALDLEIRSDAVLARAVQLAVTHAAQLVLLHVIERETLSYVAGVSGRSETDLQDELKQQMLTRLEALLSETGRTRRSVCRALNLDRHTKSLLEWRVRFPQV
jgi:nucleotide-binding universal stress UspA family protein